MTTDDTLLTLELDPRETGFTPHVYEPKAYGLETRPRFMIAVPWRLIPEDWQAGLYRGINNHKPATSFLRPEVKFEMGQAEGWVYALRRLDEMRARNLPANRWLMEHRLRVDVSRLTLPDYIVERTRAAERPTTHALVLRGVTVRERLS